MDDILAARYSNNEEGEDEDNKEEKKDNEEEKEYEEEAKMEEGKILTPHCPTFSTTATYTKPFT